MSALRCGIITLEGQYGGLVSPLVDGFKENACEVLVASEDRAWDFHRLDFVVTYGPMQSMVWVIQRLSAMEKLPPLFVWLTEQVPPPYLPTLTTHLASTFRYSVESRLFWLRRHKRLSSILFSRGGRLLVLGEMLKLKRNNLLTLIGVFTETNKLFLERHGLPVTLIPMGYHSSFGEHRNLVRDVDVLFLGSTRDRRRKQIVLQLENRFLNKGFAFVIKDGSPERGFVFGEERTTLLNRTKIVLNIMRQPWDDPVFRFLLAAPNKAMVLSERIVPASFGPLALGEHFAMADLTDIAEAAEYYLNSKEDRERVTDQAYDLVTTELTMKNMAQRVIRALGF